MMRGPGRTSACKRPPIAYARPSLRLSAAPDAQRSASFIWKEDSRHEADGGDDHVVQYRRVHCHAHPESARGAARCRGTAGDASAPDRLAQSWQLPSSGRANAEAFQQGLRDLGYVEGQNLVMEYRYAEGRDERLPELAAELVRLQVEVIVAGGSRATRAAQPATRTIPIVMAGTH